MREPTVTRRRFLQWSGATLLTPAIGSGAACGRGPVPWTEAQLVHGRRASDAERAAIADAAALIGRAVDDQVSVRAEEDTWQPGDIYVATPDTADRLEARWTCAGDTPGAFRILSPDDRDAPAVVVAGVDPEGARNGLYRLLEICGFGFMRDGEHIPSLARQSLPSDGLDLTTEPAFRWRGEMIWDNYLGPARYCAAAWGAADWERALLHMARAGHNFLEFYPPLAHVWQLAFPEADGLADGPVWRAAEKHALAKQVLARARELGVHVMYVLSYGWFPAAVRRLYPELEWAGGGFLCAHQPELKVLTRRVWQVMFDELGTDHLVAIRHRGEEGQSYSDPCRSVTKAQGMTQAYEVLRELDPDVVATVWTWAEQVPELFDELPDEIRAVHIRHGMGGMFSDVGAGREQADGRPAIDPARRWLSGQFTLFSGSETLVQTAWSDPTSLAADARTSASDPTCEGYFQWPEWTATSPWLSDTIARLAWDPGSFDRGPALLAYAAARHGAHASLFLRGFRPMIDAGNARVMVTPRQRVIVSYFLSATEIGVLDAVREGVRAMWNDWPADATPLLQRDLVDLLAWVGVRQAHVFEAEAYVAYRAGDRARVDAGIEAALASWGALQALLADMPELSILRTAARMASEAPVSAAAVDSFWVQGCDFYKGYPLVLSPEAIEFVCADQCRRLGQALASALDEQRTASLPEPGFFWHDFPDPAWADVVAGVPAEDAATFERTIRRRLSDALEQGASVRGERSLIGLQGRRSLEPLAEPTVPSVVELGALTHAVVTILGQTLPEPVAGPEAMTSE